MSVITASSMMTLATVSPTSTVQMIDR
jgi:hypothetical protein